MAQLKASARVKGFEQHGVTFNHKTDEQYAGFCPGCDQEKFYMDPQTGLWDCKKCGRSGNFQQFLKWRMEHYQKSFKSQAALNLSNSRGSRPQTLKAWGIGFDSVSSQYMIPMNSCSGVQRYKLGGKCLATAGAKLNLIHSQKMVDSKRVWITEGVWDGCILWECLNRKEDVYSLPGAGNFPKNENHNFQNKNVVICCDNDVPGFRGAARTGRLLDGIASSIKYLHWPEHLNVPDGFDIRDVHKNFNREHRQTLGFILENLKDIPNRIIDGSEIQLSESPTTTTTGKGMEPEVVLEGFRKHLRIKDPTCLDVMFGCMFANRFTFDPIWMFLVGASGGAKTELLNTLASSEKVRIVSTLTSKALVSGMNTASGDPSLLPKLNGKVLVIRDFTTILTMHHTARDEIFGTLREAYDGNFEKALGNGAIRKYKSKFGLLAGVTPSIEAYTSTAQVLGERFLKFFIDLGEATRDAIRNLGKETGSREDLKQIAAEVLSVSIPDEMPSITEEMVCQIADLADVCALLRSSVTRDRYTGIPSFHVIPEKGTRLGKQLAGIGMGICIYRHTTSVNQDVYRIIRRIGQDSIPSKTARVMKFLYSQALINGMDVSFDYSELAQVLEMSENTARYLMADLVPLRAVERIKSVGGRDEYRIHINLFRKAKRALLYEDEISS